jgi:DNA-binding GntR family transcriptional regulator
VTTSSQRPRRRRNLAEEVADHIRDAILSGAMKPGERIDQDQISDELGISRLPVREALIALHGEGLVRTIPRRGTYVERLTPNDIADHYQLFGHMAGLAASRAAARATDDQVAQMRRLHDEMAELTDPDDLERVNYELHRVINVAGGSRRLNILIDLLARSLPQHFYGMNPEWSGEAQDHHADIIDAIAARDPSSAQRAMEGHMQASARYAVEALRRQGFFESGAEFDDEA